MDTSALTRKVKEFKSEKSRHNTQSRLMLHYGLAMVATMAGWGLREAITAYAGPGLPTYITFYPAVMVVALAAGLGPGLMATGLTILIVQFRIIIPGEHLSAINVLGQIIFASMGVIMNIAAHLYRRSRDEAAVSRSLEQERDILQSVMNGARNSHLVYLDRDFNFVRVNKTYALTCGYLPEQMIGKNHFALYPQTENEAIFKRVRDTGEEASFHDKPFEFPDHPERGVTYWDWTLTPVKGPDGQVRGLVLSLFETTERKRAELALRNSEDRLHRARELLEAVTLGSKILIATVDCDLHYTFFNREHRDEMKRLTGRDTEIGMSLMEALENIPEERDKAIDLWSRALKGETVVQMLMFGDPRYYRRWYRTRHTPIRDISGEIVGAGEVTSDITELVNAQEALARSEEKYRRLFHNMVEGFALYEMIYDEEGRAVDWQVLEINNAYSRHTGISPELIVGRCISETFPSSFAEYLPVFTSVIETRIPHEFETYIKATGRHLHVVTFPLTGPLFANIVEDISERKDAQEALRRSQADFRLLSETAEQLIMWKDIQAVVNNLCKKTMDHLDCQVFFNFLMDKNAGRLHLNTFAGIPDDEAVKFEWLDIGVAVCGCAAKEGLPIIAENIFTTPDSRTDFVKSYGIQAYACHPLTIQGEVIGTLSFGTRTRASFSEDDLLLMKRITAQVATAMERARLLDEQQKLREDLENKVRERTADLERSIDALRRTNMELEDFTHVASHDLQEPLRKIMTFAERLTTLKNSSLDDQAMDYLSRAQQAAARMQLLIQDLVKYSRVTSSIKQFMVMNLRLPLEDAVKDLSVPLEETEGQIEIDALPDVKGDRIQISQLFVNLINNALKYRSNEKPLIRIFARPLSEDDGFHEIHVKDNGIGFDELYLDRIFKPFQRLHGRSSPYQGTGMGLAICHKILENHRGSINARSEPGKGSTFIIKLPKV